MSTRGRRGGFGGFVRYRRLALAILLAICAGAGSWVWMSRAPHPLVVVQAQSALVRYQVQLPSYAVIPLLKGKASFAEADAVACRAQGILVEASLAEPVLIAPKAGARVTYWRGTTGVTLQVEHENNEGGALANLSTQHGAVCVPKQRFIVLVAANDAPMLPIAGPASIGDETAPGAAPAAISEPVGQPQPAAPCHSDPAGVIAATPGLLYGGTVELYGWSRWSGTHALYPIPGLGYRIPRGSRLEILQVASIGNAAACGDGPGFDVRIATESDSLSLYQPNFGLRNAVFDTGLVARTIGDPSLAGLLLAIATFGLVLQIASSVIGMLPKKQPRKSDIKAGCPWWLSMLGLVAVLCGPWPFTAPGWAEVVHLDQIGQDDGIEQGWLFGSRRDGRCWIVMPRHVAENSMTRALAPLSFVDERGRAGETGQPIDVASVAGAQAAAGGEVDLAFAPVAIGRSDGDCPSRLGLPAEAYPQLLRSNPELSAMLNQRTSLQWLDLRLDRSTADAAGGVYLLLEATDPGIAALLMKGISGSVAQAVKVDGRPPVAMALNMPYGKVKALRFDRIRVAFDIVEGGMVSGPAAPAGVVPFTVSGVEAVPAQGALLSNLLAGTGCWNAEPTDAGVVDFILDLSAGARAEWVWLVIAPGCGMPGATTIIQRRTAAGRGWQTFHDCKVGSRCRVGLSGPQQVRLRIFSKVPVSLAGLRVD